MVHTCPRCELRFTTDAELADHLTVDHHVDLAPQRLRYQAPRSRPPGRRYLVVGNRTLSDDALLGHIRELAAAGPTHFHLVVPAIDSQGNAHHRDAQGDQLAELRARHAVDMLAAEGIIVEAEVGDPDPVKAVGAALGHEPADEIVVSVLPKGVSRWLEVDLPRSLEHHYGLPVTVITSR
jgi:hypothetical protein